MSEASMTEDKRSMQQFAGVAGNRHYNDLDGFRAIAAIAIVVMHVHVRGEYVHTSTWLSTAVEPLGTFVTLFFIISGFGMCCGYYDRVKTVRWTLSGSTRVESLRYCRFSLFWYALTS